MLWNKCYSDGRSSALLPSTESKELKESIIKESCMKLHNSPVEHAGREGELHNREIIRNWIVEVNLAGQISTLERWNSE